MQRALHLARGYIFHALHWFLFSCPCGRPRAGARARAVRPGARRPPTQATPRLRHLSHARLADNLTPPSHPASHLRLPPPPLPRSPPAPRGERHATPARSFMVARLVASSKPIAAKGQRAGAAAAAVGAATGKPAASSPPHPLQPNSPSIPPQPPERTPLSGHFPQRRTARSAAQHHAWPVSPPRHHHPLAQATRTAPPSPRHRPAHSTTRAAAWRHSQLPASATARHGHTIFHASRLSPILAFSCPSKI